MTDAAKSFMFLWGLQYAAGQLRDVIRRESEGGPEATDEEVQKAIYVELTPGYHVAKPVLVHVYARFHEPQDFDPCLPGESLTDALERLGWRSAMGLSRRQVGPWVHDRFILALESKMAKTPFTLAISHEAPVLPLAPERTRKQARHERFLEQVAKQRHAELRSKIA